MPAASGSFEAMEEHRVYKKEKYIFQGSVRHMYMCTTAVKNQAPAPAATSTAAYSTPCPAAPPGI